MLNRIQGFAEADVAGEFEGEVLFADPDFTAVEGGAVFALAEVEGELAVVTGSDFVRE